MKIIGSIVGAYAACTLLAAGTAAFADEPVANGAPQAGSQIDSLDSAIQRLSSGQPAALSTLPQASPQAPAPPPPISQAITSPTVTTTNASFAPVSAPAAPVAVNRYVPTYGIKPPPAAQPAQTASALNNSPVLWVYEFSATWCPSCRKLAPVVEEAAAKYNGFIKYVPVNIDKNQDLVKKLNIAQIPTVIVIDRAGRTLNRLVGLQQGSQIDVILDHYKAQTMASLGITQ